MSEEKGKNLGLLEAHTPPKYQQEQGECQQSQEAEVGESQEVGESVEKRREDMEEQAQDGGVDDGRARPNGESAGERLQGNKAVQARARKVRGEVERLAGLLEGSAEQMDLLAGGADELEDGDALAVAARVVSEVRRGRGRPKGAANVRNTRVFDYLEALGHRDPLVTLSLIQTADTRALARMVGMTAADALRIQVMAAKEMLPYKYAKKPQELNVNEQRAHIFLTGTLDVNGADEDDGTLSIFGNKINGIIEGDA